LAAAAAAAPPLPSYPAQVNRDCPKYIIHTPPAATHAQAQDEAAAAAAAGASGGGIAVRSLFRPTTEHALLLNVRRPKGGWWHDTSAVT
jgi:hypothetical protein